ncbi:MAG TPA: hypothetical protein VFN14_06315 [Candidatus Limnocylindria bacterium]|nr:hypothetical protein [Candidatus Limnocylindria bacterium]
MPVIASAATPNTTIARSDHGDWLPGSSGPVLAGAAELRLPCGEATVAGAAGVAVASAAAGAGSALGHDPLAFSALGVATTGYGAPAGCGTSLGSGAAFAIAGSLLGWDFVSGAGDRAVFSAGTSVGEPGAVFGSGALYGVGAGVAGAAAASVGPARLGCGPCAGCAVNVVPHLPAGSVALARNVPFVEVPETRDIASVRPATLTDTPRAGLPPLLT